MSHDDRTTPCSPDAHNFQPKRRTVLPFNVGSKTGSTEDISELYCVQCGQVMLLTGREGTEVGKITLARPS